ncbi:hypothetical protein C8J56DRAFT_1119812 [Mycena floridula]|nr:hypothetical protein C8J56DRAFT_1119812 [Mycena floridula]
MIPDETLLLKNAGQILVQDFFSVVSWPSAMVLNIFHWKLSSLLLTRMHQLKHNKTTATWALCTLLTLIFIVTTASFSLFIAICFKLIIGALIENTELELLERLDIANASTTQIVLAYGWLNGDSNSLLCYNFTSIDSTGNLCLALYSGQASSLFIAGATMSIVTNLMAIILIGLKAYQHRKFMKDTIGSGHSAAGKVLMFLTESDIIIDIFLAALDDTQGTALDDTTQIWGSMKHIVTAIYPSLVILIVTNRHSISHTTDGSTAGGDRNLGTHISFAHSASEGTTDFTKDQAAAGVQSMIKKHHDTEKVLEA